MHTAITLAVFMIVYLSMFIRHVFDNSFITVFILNQLQKENLSNDNWLLELRSRPYYLTSFCNI